MSKQSARRSSRQEQRLEKQRQREEELRRAARTKRITTIGIAIGGVLFLAALIYLVILQSHTPANAAYPAVDGVSCDGGEHGDVHIHAHLSIYIDGNKTSVPANIGIAPDSSCLYWLHTHSSDGVVHIEAPAGSSLTLGTFLDIWGSHFAQLGYPGRLSDLKSWQVYVNGKLFTGNLRTVPLQSHALITLTYNSPAAKPDTSFDWNGL